MSTKAFIRRTGAVIVVVGALVAGGWVLAQEQQPPQTRITQEQARDAALAAVPGTVLEIELENEGGRTFYEVEIQPRAGGQPVEVRVDPSTGAVLGTSVGEDDPSGRNGTNSNDDR